MRQPLWRIFSGYNKLYLLTVSTPMTSDRPPALFVGEHLALDFLNTTAAPQGR